MSEVIESFFAQSGFSKAQQKVLDSALTLFMEKGFYKTTIPDIVEHSGVSTGSIYHAFSGKEDLAETMMNTLFELIELQQAEVVQDKSSAFEQYQAMVTWMIDTSVNYPRMMRFILYARHNEFMPDVAPACSSKPFMNLRKIMVDGMTQGSVRQMDDLIAASFAFGGVLRMIQLSLDGALEQPLKDSLAEIIECGWRSVSVAD